MNHIYTYYIGISNYIYIFIYYTKTQISWMSLMLIHQTAANENDEKEFLGLDGWGGIRYIQWRNCNNLRSPK